MTLFPKYFMKTKNPVGNQDILISKTLHGNTANETLPSLKFLVQRKIFNSLTYRPIFF